MNKVLIVFAHPRLENSRVNRALIDRLPDDENVTFHDLYEQFPDFNIDVNLEKLLLAEHDVLVWHHPLYWYSAPSLLKQWIDIVLEYGWAYGPHGDVLQGKFVFNALTSGGARDVYSKTGRNRFTIREFLAPFEQTARLCGMNYLPPFAVQGTHKISDEDLERAAESYRSLIDWLVKTDLADVDFGQFEFLNDWLS